MTDWRTGVEIATAGMEWPASTGPATVTMENLADAVAASQDPHVQLPRIRLGHTSALNDGMPRNDPFAALGDAEPAFGRFTNLRLVNDGAVLLGDVIDTPGWLTDGAPTLFPNRSMECNWDVQTPGGKRYSMVITAVALLGVELPAVQDLEDLVSFALNGPPPEAKMPAPTAASVSVSAIRDRFNFEWAASEPLSDQGIDTYWWWVRDVRVDPNEIIADDDEGNLWSVPYTTDGEDAVTFGEPSKVRETYVPVTAAAASIEATAPASQRVLATFSRPTKQDPSTTTAAASAGPENERNTIMDDTVRDVLVGQGLDPDAATEEQINAAQVLATAQPTPDPDPDPAAVPAAVTFPDSAPTVDPETGLVTRPAPDPIAATADRERSEMSARIAELEAQATARTETEDRQRRDAFADGWVREGRLAPAEREHYRGLLDVDEQRTVALAQALAPGRIPVSATGARTPADDSSQFTSTGWFPQLASKES